MQTVTSPSLEFDEGVDNGVRVMRDFRVVFVWDNLYVQQCDYVFFIYCCCFMIFGLSCYLFSFLLGSHCVLFI